MSQVALSHDIKAGPMEPEVRAVTLNKLGLQSTDHLVDVGPCTGSATIEAARRVEHVTAAEYRPDRLDVTRKDFAANDYDAGVMLREAEAPDGPPTDADVTLVGDGQSFKAVLDHAVETGVDRIVMGVSRVKSAGDVIEALRGYGPLSVVTRLQVSHSYKLAGVTSFQSNNLVYVVVGRRDAEGL